MKKIKISLVILLFAISFSSFAQSKVAHINTTELVASMPEMNDAKAELEKLAKTYETDIQTMAAELQSKVKQYDTEAAAQTDEENAKRLQEVQGMEQSIRQYQGQAQQELQKKEDALPYDVKRQREYAKLNQFEMQFDDQVNGTTTWIDAINAIKVKYPKEGS